MKHWQKVAAVQRMQDYIAANINKPISLSQLGLAAGYSPWHAARAFKELTGYAPFEYIRTMRLSQAAKTLMNGNALHR